MLNKYVFRQLNIIHLHFSIFTFHQRKNVKEFEITEVE